MNMQDWKYCCDILIRTGLFVLRNPVLSALLFLVFVETIFELVIELSLFAFFVFALLIFALGFMLFLSLAFVVVCVLIISYTRRVINEHHHIINEQ